MNRHISYAALLLFVLTFASCRNSNPPATAAASPQTGAATSPDIVVAKDAQGLQTLTVSTSSIPEYLEISGRVVPDPSRVVHVFPSAGGRLLEMKVRPWDRVEKGQMLALLESSDASRAVADYEKAQVDAEVKKKALDRANDLYAHRAAAQKEVEQAQGDMMMAEKESKAALDRVHLLGVDPAAGSNQLRVTAPRAGVVLDIGAASGEFSKSLDSPQPLCTIADLSTVWIEGDVFEKDIALLKKGAEARVSMGAYPGQTWNGRVSVVSDAVDPATHTVKIRVELANPQQRLRPNMFATLRLLRSSSQGLLIPASAVVREGSTAYVFVDLGSNRYERREVKLGRPEDDNIEITSGLPSGSNIISQGALLLRAVSRD